MRKNKFIEYTNFVCKFGDQNLLDYADTVVVPAFRPGFIRQSYGSSYFFLDVKYLNLGTAANPMLAIAGRFIKVTKLTRDQIYDDETKQLVADPAYLDTALSAVFVLILNNHRLLYVKETTQAPDSSTFARTCQIFFRQSLDVYRQQRLYEARAAVDNERQKRSITINTIARQIPNPSVHIEYLGSDDSIAPFINRFQSIQSIRIQLLTTNNESDNNILFGSFRKAKQDLGATQAQVVFADKNGLVKEEVQSQLEVAAAQGINNIVVEGVDANGDILSGDNLDYSLKTPFPGSTDNIPATAQAVVKSYQSVFGKKDGKEESDANANTIDRIKQLFDYIEI